MEAGRFQFAAVWEQPSGAARKISQMEMGSLLLIRCVPQDVLHAASPRQRAKPLEHIHKPRLPRARCIPAEHA